MENLQSSPAGTTRNLDGLGAQGNSPVSNQFPEKAQGNQEPAGLSLGKTLQSGPSGLPPKLVDKTTSNHRILFLVNKGADHKLAQICVAGLSCHLFFDTLRKKYFRLRGFLRCWLSVWQYSHCDFYMVSN